MAAALIISCCLLALLTAGPARGSPLVALSPLGHFTCPGACQEAVGEAPAGAVDSMVKFLMEGITAGATPSVLKASLSDVVQEPLEVVLLVVVDKADESNLNILQEFSSPVLGTSTTGSSYLGTFFNPEGDGHISAASLIEEFGGAKVRTPVEIHEMAVDDQIVTNRVPDLVITTAEQVESGFSEVVKEFAAKANNNLALIFVAEAGFEDSVGGVDAKDEPVDTNDMRPPEINVATLTGLLTAALLLLIFIPGFMCLWNIEGPLSFESASDRDSAKKKNI